MQVSVRFNSVLAQRVGAARLRVVVGDDATIADLMQQLAATYPGLEPQLARAVPILGSTHVTPAARCRKDKKSLFDAGGRWGWLGQVVSRPTQLAAMPRFPQGWVGIQSRKVHPVAGAVTEL
jgi:hypothetical protein